ncbi:COG4223 family protein [Asticcacaulis sp. AND118]|uniref:COG4223 family protein n=1 Tax=Asticcacaulis sp. AND118 TaxID=2840468 RepID=UPI001D00101E|nr:mitofilin family membrane protein [Asticcacaulis sp. AND118]UDF04149.1 hypothetical protein LH365_03660 [Asticcacaulis sp. AND118]
MTDDFAPNPIPAAAEPEKARWGRGPLIIAFAFPIVFVVLALGVLGYGLMKEAAQKSFVGALPSAAAISADSEKDSEIARLTAELNALRVRQAQAAVETPQGQGYASDPVALSRLSARLDRLEANQRLLIQAAAAATSASGLQQAAKGSQPFLSELADVEKSLTDTALVAPLRPLAQKGVPSEIALALSFPEFAAKARTAAGAKTDDSFLSRLSNALGSLISIRRVDSAARGPDALLLQAQGRLDEGDLNGALSMLATLPTTAQTALKPWLTDARNRVLVDTTTRRITVDALSRLSQANYSTANGADLATGGVNVGAGITIQPETGRPEMGL